MGPTIWDHKWVSTVLSYGGDTGTRYCLRTDGWTKGYRISWSGLWPVELTRVSGETGALLVFSCLITYKRFSQRYQVNMMIYKGVIVNKSSSSYRLNVCSLNVSDGNYLKTVKDTQNQRPQYRKPSKRGFQIISYMFNLNVKLPLANQICCTHYMCIIIT